MVTSDCHLSLSVPTAAGELPAMPAASFPEAGRSQDTAHGFSPALGCGGGASDVLVATAAGQSSVAPAEIRAFWPGDDAVAVPAMTDVVGRAAASEPEQLQPDQAGFEPVRTRASRNSRRAQKQCKARTQPAQAEAEVPVAVGTQAEASAEDCVVCWSAAAEVLFQPCGHFICCAACAGPFLARGMPCPMCRVAVSASVCLV